MAAGLGIRLLKWILPVVVSAGAFGFLMSRIDLSEVLEQVDLGVALVLIPAVLAYAAMSLWLEAESLSRLASERAAVLGKWTCAQIKAASYPLGLLNYALGAGALTLLLRRRGGLAISDAAGMVVLIALIDLGLLFVLSALGSALHSTQALALQAGVIVACVMVIIAGFGFLRTQISLGPLDRIRELELFRAARETPSPKLAMLMLLRLGFVASFIGLCGAALVAFNIHVPLGDLVVGVAVVSLVASLPIAVAGLGTGQVAFVYMFRQWGSPELLLASNLALSAALIVMRSGLGLIFAREYTREAFAAARETNE